MRHSDDDAKRFVAVIILSKFKVNANRAEMRRHSRESKNFKRR